MKLDAKLFLFFWVVMMGLSSTTFADSQLASECSDYISDTPLIDAVQKRFPIEDVEAILKTRRGAKTVNIQGKYGYTALLNAISLKNYEVAKLLLEYNADPNIEDCFRNSPVYELFSKLNDSGKTTEMFRLFIKNGLDIKKWSLSKLLITDLTSSGPLDYPAAKYVPANVVKIMIELGSPIDELGNMPGEHYWSDVVIATPLMNVVKQKRLDLAKILVDAGADINFAKNKYGYNALSFALETENFEMIKFLINQGARLAKWNRYSYMHDTFYYVSNMRERLSAAEIEELHDLLVRAGLEQFFGGSGSALNYAININDDIAIKKFLGYYKPSDDISDEIENAFNAGKFSIVEQLLRYQDFPICMNVYRSNRGTPDYFVNEDPAQFCTARTGYYAETWYTLLAYGGSAKGAEFLLKNSIIKDLNAYSGILLRTAAKYNNLNLVKYLLQLGTISYLNEALVTAIINSNLEMVKVLIDGGANINVARTSHKDCQASPLICAITKESSSITLELLPLVTDINVTYNGVSALSYAIGYSRLVLALALISKGADLGILDENRNTLYMTLAGINVPYYETQQIEVAKALWKAGARNITARNAAGKSAVDIAEENGHKRLAEALLKLPFETN